jgi:hypothetical protein
MGRDIHVYAEMRVVDAPAGEPWVNLAMNFNVQRDGRLFSIFAGAGGDSIAPMAGPRGLPPDCDLEIASAAREYGQRGHGHSFLTFAELVKAQELYIRPVMHVTAARWIAAPTELPVGWSLLADDDVVAARIWKNIASLPRSGRDLMLAVHREYGSIGPNQDLAAILSYLSVYEDEGATTRVVFWFTG